jgi:hydroxymethylpyrimidine/phosphomethylpyrimidine kinase
MASALHRSMRMVISTRYYTLLRSPECMQTAMTAACTIAGSDSGGGAGIQADLKTFTAIGVWGTTVITAITAQNPRHVLGVSTIPEEMVALQIDAVLEDFEIAAFKTGMLGTAGIIRTVARKLPEGIPLVVDPVMVATSGARLLELDAEQELIDTLLPISMVVTPNVPEAMVLSGLEKISGRAGMLEAAWIIRSLGPEYVIIKGGHLEGKEVNDLLVGKGVEIFLSGPRYPHHVHGSGCCFSAAMAGYLALGLSVEEAFHKSKAFIGQAIKGASPDRSGSYSVNPPD